MAIKVTFDINISPLLTKMLASAAPKPIDKDTMEEVGTQVVTEMRQAISTGNSPIQGVGKFPKYKNPSKYPGKRKPHTPVNLNLKGDFQEALTHKVEPSEYGYSTAIFYEGKEEIKEKGHREGANGQPKRPTIPASKGQNFSARIKLIYTRLIRERILAVLQGKG